MRGSQDQEERSEDHEQLHCVHARSKGVYLRTEVWHIVVCNAVGTRAQHIGSVCTVCVRLLCVEYAWNRPV